LGLKLKAKRKLGRFFYSARRTERGCGTLVPSQNPSFRAPGLGIFYVDSEMNFWSGELLGGKAEKEKEKKVGNLLAKGSRV